MRERLVDVLEASIWPGVFRPWVWAVILAASLVPRRARGSAAVRMLVVGGLGHQAAILAAAGTAVSRDSWPMMVCAVLVLAIEARCAWEAVVARRARRWSRGSPPTAEQPVVGDGDGGDAATEPEVATPPRD